MQAWDTVIVGAGILGLATARELLSRNPDARVLVLERENEIAAHQTSHNCGVVHAGIYYTPGSLKSQLCTEGRGKMYDYCDQHGIKYEKCGKIIIALDEQRARRSSTSSNAEAARTASRACVACAPTRSARSSRTPSASPRCSRPRRASSTSPPSPGRWPTRSEPPARRSRPASTCDRLSRSNGTTIVHTSEGPIPTARAVACAGLWSDRLAVASGEPDDLRIVPFRGSYLKLKPQARHLVKTLIYPVPDPSLPFLGVHADQDDQRRHLARPDRIVGPVPPRVLVAHLRPFGRHLDAVAGPAPGR